MTQETIVMFIAIALHDRGLDFAANPADWADRRFGANTCAGDEGPSADRGWPLDDREWLDPRRIDHQRAVARIEHERAVEPCLGVDEDLRGVVHDNCRIGARSFGRIGPASRRIEQRQIAYNLLAVRDYQVPRKGE